MVFIECSGSLLWRIDIRTQFMTRDTSERFNVEHTLVRDAFVLLPLGYRGGFDAERLGERGHGSSVFNRSVQGSELRRINSVGRHNAADLRTGLNWRQQGTPNVPCVTVGEMPKTRVNKDAERFAERLRNLLNENGIARRGAGAYLAKKYKVSNVVANAWINGEYKPHIDKARAIARDHNTDFDLLYFGKKSANHWPFSFPQERYERLTPGQKIVAEATLLGAIVDMEDATTGNDTKSIGAKRR